MLSAEPPFLGWAVLTCNNRRQGSRTSGEWASPPLRVTLPRGALAGSCTKRCGGAKGYTFISRVFFAFFAGVRAPRSRNKTTKREKNKTTTGNNMQHNRLQIIANNTNVSHQLLQYFVRSACQPSMFEPKNGSAESSTTSLDKSSCMTLRLR